MTHLKPSI